MKVFILVKVDFGHRENIGVFDTEDKAKAYKTGSELDILESGNACGISYYIEEFSVV